MEFPTPLVLTNDDGIDAQGIAALRRVTGHGILVAPREQHSGCSHRVTLFGTIAIDRRSDTQFAVDAAPVDCVRLALAALEIKPAMIISGINEGANLGHDTYLSGTVAAAREAAALGVPAIAISQYRKGQRIASWAQTEALAARALEAVLEQPIPPRGFWNINLPNVLPGDPAPELVFCERCRNPLPNGYREVDGGFQYRRDCYHQRKRDPGTDVDVCFGGNIAVTWMEL